MRMVLKSLSEGTRSRHVKQIAGKLLKTHRMIQESVNQTSNFEKESPVSMEPVWKI